ncbi:MAG: hypothetical protein O7G86_00135 [Gammaproteobacteria bacterium]|nr:hypothetical protein [Gammaproteobacteria bacterium]
MSKSVPFKVDEYEGFATSQGIVFLFEDTIVVQYETKDALIGMVKSGLKEIEIPLDVVEEVTFNAGLFRNKLTIAVNDMDYCVDVPGGDGNRISLRIKKKYADNAEDFVQAVLLRASELNG